MTREGVRNDGVMENTIAMTPIKEGPPAGAFFFTSLTRVNNVYVRLRNHSGLERIRDGHLSIIREIHCGNVSIRKYGRDTNSPSWN